MKTSRVGLYTMVLFIFLGVLGIKTKLDKMEKKIDVLIKQKL